MTCETFEVGEQLGLFGYQQKLYRVTVDILRGKNPWKGLNRHGSMSRDAEGRLALPPVRFSRLVRAERCDIRPEPANPQRNLSIIMMSEAQTPPQ